jgi:hypothetical protein
MTKETPMHLTNRSLLAMAVCLSLTSAASADPVVHHAVHDPTPGFESYFTFDFGGGFTETATISNTDFRLSLNDLVAPAGDARFLSYYQQIASINLPDPTGGSTPVPTGNITVQLLDRSYGNGTFDPATGEFTTSEIYRIHYNGDLSAYGLTEGFVDLPSTSQGTVVFEKGIGRIQQTWDGNYTFPNTNVTVSYQCRVNTQIVPEPMGSTLATIITLGGYVLFRRRR